MTITLELPEELERVLIAEASLRGCSLAEYAVQLHATAVPRDPDVKDGASLVAYWKREGLIGCRPDILDPADYARRLREEAQRRTQL